MHMYRFDQPMGCADAQTASALRKVVLELSEVTFHGCLNVIDARFHGGQQEWTQGQKSSVEEPGCNMLGLGFAFGVGNIPAM